MSDGPRPVLPDPAPTPEDEASDWDARLRAPGCSEQDRQAFKAWKEADPKNAAAYDALQDMLAMLRGAKDDPQIRSMVETAVQTSKPPVWRRTAPLAGLGSLAAATAFGVFMLTQVGIPSTTGPSQGEFQIVATDTDPSPGAMERSVYLPPFYATGFGELEEVDLGEGSIATLNTASLIKQDFTDEARKIELLRGQASFDVAKDAERPFTVYAGDRAITAIGTVFDVRVDDDRIDVILIEGLIDIVQTDENGQTEPPLRLTAGNRFTAMIGAPVNTTETANLQTETLWQEGRVFFEETRLTDALSELDRYIEADLIAADPALSGLYVSGTFKTDDPEGFVADMAQYFELTVDRSAPGRIVISASE